MNRTGALELTLCIVASNSNHAHIPMYPCCAILLREPSVRLDGPTYKFYYCTYRGATYSATNYEGAPSP